MTYITASEVRNICGAPGDLITDEQLNQYIEEVESEMKRWMNTVFTPKEVIEIHDGNGTSRIFTKKNPVLSVRALTLNNNVSITPAGIDWYKSSGKLWLGTGAECATFLEGHQNTFIKYVYGMVEESDKESMTLNDVSKGKSVEIEIGNASQFAVNDWVEIYGMDGNREAFKITSIDAGANKITADVLVKDHSADSKTVKLQIPDFIRKYMLIEAGICAGINAMGATYVFNASYGLGDLNVTKGVPYTHWKASVDYLLKERELRKSRIRPRPAIVT